MERLGVRYVSLFAVYHTYQLTTANYKTTLACHLFLAGCHWSNSFWSLNSTSQPC